MDSTMVDAYPGQIGGLCRQELGHDRKSKESSVDIEQEKRFQAIDSSTCDHFILINGQK